MSGWQTLSNRWPCNNIKTYYMFSTFIIYCTALHCTAHVLYIYYLLLDYSLLLHSVRNYFSFPLLPPCAAQLLHCTALHCTALHCTALHYTALHCTAIAEDRLSKNFPVARNRFFYSFQPFNCLLFASSLSDY
jgi:hypothetical protein